MTTMATTFGLTFASRYIRISAIHMYNYRFLLLQWTTNKGCSDIILQMTFLISSNRGCIVNGE